MKRLGLAGAIAKLLDVAYLDLDTIAWKPDQPDVRKIEPTSVSKLDAFLNSSDHWVIEGCYSGLIVHATKHTADIIFMNPRVEACIENCRSRPWEPHKYASKDEQDERLGFLLDWVREYETRSDEFSAVAHQKLFDEFIGRKVELNSNEEATSYLLDLER